MTRPWPELARRHAEVASLLAVGETCRTIGAHLGISSKTVDFYRNRLLKKLGLRGNVDLARYAIRHGYVPIADPPPLPQTPDPPARRWDSETKSWVGEHHAAGGA